MFSFWLLCSIFGCDTVEQYSQCDPPDEHLGIMFKAEDPRNPFSHSFCVVCNNQLEASGYGDWVLAMGAESAPNNPEDYLPCLYVYPPENGSEIDSFASCRALVCDGTASYNDMVSPSNSNFDLQPILP